MEMLAAFLGKTPVDMFLGKLFLQAALRLKRLHGLHAMKSLRILVCWVQVFGHVDILLGHHHSPLKRNS